jgi:hypothetical protein
MAIKTKVYPAIDRLLHESKLLAHARLADSTKAALSDQNNLAWSELKKLLHSNPTDIVELISQTLPIRQSVYWGLLCGQACPGFGQVGPAAETVQATLRWALRPSEETRKPCVTLAEGLPWISPEGLLARAVAWSEGSIMPPHIPVFVPAPSGVTGQFVAGAILTLAATIEVVNYNHILHQFISIAEDIACENLLPAGWHLDQLAGQHAFNPVQPSKFNTFPGIGDRFF